MCQGHANRALTSARNSLGADDGSFPSEPSSGSGGSIACRSEAGGAGLAPPSSAANGSVSPFRRGRKRCSLRRSAARDAVSSLREAGAGGGQPERQAGGGGGRGGAGRYSRALGTGRRYVGL